MGTSFKGQAHDLAPTLVLVSAVRRDSAAMRARRLWKPVSSPLAFRHLLVVLCEPQLSQSRRRKVVRRIGHRHLLTSGPTLENQCAPSGPVSAAPTGASTTLV